VKEIGMSLHDVFDRVAAALPCAAPGVDRLTCAAGIDVMEGRFVRDGLPSILLERRVDAPARRIERERRGDVVGDALFRAGQAVLDVFRSVEQHHRRRAPGDVVRRAGAGRGKHRRGQEHGRAPYQGCRHGFIIVLVVIGRIFVAPLCGSISTP
jgi:hypothetical protein